MSVDGVDEHTELAYFMKMQIKIFNLCFFYNFDRKRNTVSRVKKNEETKIRNQENKKGA